MRERRRLRTGVDRKIVTERLIEARHECWGRQWGDAIRLAITLTLLFAPHSARAQGSVPAEYKLRPAYLTTFPSFIEWPETAFASAEAPFLVCVIGDFRFGTALAEFVRNPSLHGRRIDAREMMRFKATHDALTSIWNRGVIVDLLGRELSIAT
jgi:YfiR/HmsC-like